MTTSVWSKIDEVVRFGPDCRHGCRVAPVVAGLALDPKVVVAVDTTEPLGTDTGRPWKSVSVPRDSPWGMASALPGMAVGFRTDVAATARPSGTAPPLRTGAFLLRSAPLRQGFGGQAELRRTRKAAGHRGEAEECHHGPLPRFFLDRCCISDGRDRKEPLFS